MKRLMLAAMLAVVVLAGCGNTKNSSEARVTDASGADVSQMPAGFRNFAYKCVNVQGEWFAVFVASRGGSGSGPNVPSGLAAVPDPKCSHAGT